MKKLSANFHLLITNPDAVRFIAVVAGKLSSADLWCRLMPMIREVLQADIDEFSEEKLLQALERPVG